MYLMRFLDVTLDTCQDTSGYMYLGRFITIHQDTQRYKITIHVSWTRHDDTSRYNQDTQSMGTLITRLSVELDAADELQPTTGRTAAAVCWAANCAPEGGIRVSGAGMGSK